MKPLKIIVGAICIFLLQNASFGQMNEPKGIYNDSLQLKKSNYPMYASLGLDCGWESPYGTGFDLGVLINETLNLNLGCGLGGSGIKVGAGSRIFFLRNSFISPMMGVYLYHSTGVKSMRITVNGVEGLYKYNSNNAVLINGGLRLKVHKAIYLTGCLGYSIPSKEEKAIYISGSDSEAVKSFANSLGVGGISVSAGIIINLSQDLFKDL